MQTTLLGIAIAFILALIAALVGPVLIDWSRYRAEFEARSAQIIGLDFRIHGRIDARLLPTPTVILHDVEFGQGDRTVHARALRVEYALGSLMRGEWRIDDAWLEGPEVEIALDTAGHILWPLPSDGGFAPKELSIRQLSISDGRVTFVNAASGSRFTLDKFDFTGTFRSMLGPVQGDGAFISAGHRYPFRISLGRVGDGGRAQLHFNVDQIDGLKASVDLAIWLERRTPRFEGSVALARLVGRAFAEGVVDAPWHLTSRVKGDSSAAAIEQIELQYGGDDRAIKLRGGAKVTFGSQPQLDGVFSAPQLDLDRVLSLPQEIRTKPLAVIAKLTDVFSGAPSLPLSVKLGLSVESLTLAGGTIQRLHSELRNDGDTWHIDTLDLRAPGLTQVRLSGSFDPKSGGPTFKGNATINSADPRALTAWLNKQVDPQTIAPGSFRVSGELSLSSETIAVDRLNAEIDRVTMLGSLAYSWVRDGRPARLDATLTAPEIDFDRIYAVAKAITADVGFDWPQAGSLSLKIGRTTVAGIEVKQSDVKIQIDNNGIDIEQLSIADFDGIALVAKGRIDTQTQLPRGAVTFDLNASSLKGATALAERFAPQMLDGLRRLAVDAIPIALRGSLALEPNSDRTKPHTVANLKLDGRAGAVRVALHGNTGIANDAFKTGDLATLGTAELNVSGRLDTDDGRVLVNLIGLERFIVADRQSGRLSITAKGPLDGELAIGGRLAVGELDISATGMVRAIQRTNRSAALQVKIANAQLRSPRPPAPKRPVGVLATSINFGIALTEDTMRLTDAKGTVAGSSIAGWITIDTEQRPIRVDGRLELGSVDLGAVIGTAIGIPETEASKAPDWIWQSGPFDQAVHGASGQITVTADRVELTPKLLARSFQGKLHIGETQLALQVVDAIVASGRVTGELVLLREGTGLVARSRVQLTDADAAELLPGDGKITGRFAAEISIEGTGMSPIALIGDLEGRGRVTLTNGRLARLNPAAFDVVITAVDQGLPIDAGRVRDKMDAALASGDLAIRRAEAAISIEGGQARMLSNPILGTPDLDLAVNGLVNLADGRIDARLILSAAGARAPKKTSPEIVVGLKGPIDAPARTIDTSAFTNWLALRAIEQQSENLNRLQGRAPGQNAPSTTAPLPAVQQP